MSAQPNQVAPSNQVQVSGRVAPRGSNNLSGFVSDKIVSTKQLGAQVPQSNNLTGKVTRLKG